MRIAYLTGEYPRVTDTFIQLEVAELRRLGATVLPFSVRRPRNGQALSSAQKEERDRTSYLLPPPSPPLIKGPSQTARLPKAISFSTGTGLENPTARDSRHTLPGSLLFRSGSASRSAPPAKHHPLAQSHRRL